MIWHDRLLKILLPEILLSDTLVKEELLKSQTQAIQAGAVYDVMQNTWTYMHGFSVHKKICVHVNIHPTARDNLDYMSIGNPLSLVEFGGLVIAGVFVTSGKNCSRFDYDRRNILLPELTCSYLKAFKR
jgi:hypothetical protein